MRKHFIFVAGMLLSGAVSAYQSMYTGPGIEAVLNRVVVGTPIESAPISSGALATPLSTVGVVYSTQLSSDVTTWTVALPSGGNAATYQYGALVRFSAPSSGGPYSVAIPSEWGRAGELSAVSLSAGEKDIICSLYSTPSNGREYACFQVL